MNIEPSSKPFLDCLKLEMQEDESLKGFFEALERHVQKIRRARGSEYEKQAREMDEIVNKFAKKKAKIVAKLKEKGITLTENVHGPCYDLREFELGKKTPEYRRFDFAEFFNGLHLTIEMISNLDDTTFRERLENQKSKSEALKQRAEGIKRQLRRNRLLFFNNNVKEQDEGLKEELREIELELDKEEQMVHALEAFDNLTPEQKELIRQYLETNEAIKKGARAINRFIEQFKSSIPPKTDLVVMNEALEKMTANGMTEESLLIIFEKLDLVEEKRKIGRYPKNRVVSTKNMEVEQTFIDSVYMLNKEKASDSDEHDEH